MTDRINYPQPDSILRRANKKHRAPSRNRETEDAHQFEALRSAVEAGVADIEAGRFKAFDSKESLHAHLESVIAKVIAER